MSKDSPRAGDHLGAADGAEDGLFHDHGMRAVAHALRQYAHGIEVLQYIPELIERGESVAMDVPGVLTLDETDLMLQAALAGEGLAYLSNFATADHVASGRLERVLEDWSPAFPGLRLYYLWVPKISSGAGADASMGYPDGGMRGG